MYRFKKPVEHPLEELQEMLKKKPIRVAQRLLREFGDMAESTVILHFPKIKEREELLKTLKLQRQRWETRNWNKGYVKTY